MTAPRRFRSFLGAVLALAALLAGAPALAQTATITASNPATLNQSNLRAATLTVTLASATYESTAAASHFTLTTAISGLTVDGVAFNSGRTAATVYLRWDGTDFNAAATIAVTVAAAGTSHSAALTTGTVAVGMARWVNVSTKNVALTEGGSAGTYTVTLESPPTGTVTVTVVSDHTAAVTRSPGTLTFTTTSWNTPQTVTVTPVADNADTVDEVALVNNIATGGGYSSTAASNRTVRVTVADDDARTGTDYDTDDDGLIEINSVAKLNAVRHDLDGNGSTHATYTLAFPSAAAGMGCPDSGDADQTGNCTGYELTENLDFDTDGDGAVDAREPYANWTPIGGNYSATFEGNNHTISHLTMNASGHAGLFHTVGGTVRRLGLVDVSVSSSSNSLTNVGALAAHSHGTVVAVYVSGTVSVTVNGGSARVGGLVGNPSGGIIKACYSTAAVSANASSFIYAGGVAGLLGGQVAVSYATGTVAASGSASAQVGGLAGATNTSGASITNSYATGAVSNTATGSGGATGGLVGVALGGAGSASASYWDSQTTGRSSSGLGATQTTNGLRSPTGYTGIYRTWDTYDIDGDGRVDADDDAWDFGQANQYPALKWGGLSVSTQFTAQLVGQTDTAPSYSGISVSAKTYAFGAAIQPFQIPPPTGGNGTYDYTVAGLPSGLVFDEDGTSDCMAARTVCGTPSVWGVATVTVTVADADANIMNSDRASLTFTVTVEAPPLVVRVSPNRLSLAEGGSGAYTVVLSHAPMGPVTVGVSSDNPAVTVATSSLTFTTLNWNMARSVTVTGAGDADAVDEAATITNAASGGGYNGVSGFVRVGVADDEPSAGTDYDADNDGLIDVDSLAKLNAMRWDVDGDGAPSSGNAANYAAAFAGAAAGMGCPDGPDANQLADACAGYALTADLDFDTDDDGDVDADDEFASWTPIVGWDATLDGRGHTISNLTVTGAGDDRGMFSTATTNATVRALGLADVSVTGTGVRLGALAGVFNGRVAAVYATGVVRGAGGVGGLVAETQSSSARIVASYSTVAVECTSNQNWARAGGLAARNDGTITTSYAAGPITGDCPAAVKGGLVSVNNGTVTASHWDADQTGIADDGDSTSPAGLSSSAMWTPTAYGANASDVYNAWDDQDVDGDGAVDEDPWDFGGALNHPVLKWGGLDPADQRTNYDADGDRLIEISTLGQLNAVRWDLDGDGAPSSGNESSYYGVGAFFNGVFNPSGVGFCPTTEDDADDNDCLGYELLNDLDFDTDGDGQTHTGGTGDDDDAYYNADDGWVPIGPNETPGAATHYRARFDGNGHVIDNLFVKRSRNYSGLFAALSDAAAVTSLGLPDAYVGDGQGTVGMLAGLNRGRVAAVWSSGSVTARGNVGGLVGAAQATSTVVASYSTATVVCTQAGAYRAAGGLVGANGATSTIAASYSTGTVTGPCGLRRAFAYNEGTVAASYWDTTLSQIMDDTEDPPQPPEGRTTAVLQAPTDYDTVVGSPGEAIYAAWDDQDVDGDGATGDGDDADPWDFGLSNQHPILKYRGLAAAPQLDAQPDSAPDFGTATVTNKTFQNGQAIQAFQIPAAGAGNGALVYAESGLPTGLVFDADGSGSCAGNAPRTVCGTPTADTAAVTVTITVSDSDSTMGSGDEDALTFTVEVVTPSAAISSPAALAEATLSNATVTVELTNAAFEAGVTSSSFTLATNPALPGLSVASVATVNAGDTSATLTLGYSGGNFDTVRALSVTVADAAHTLVGALTTATVNIVPTPSVAVNPTSLSLTEGGSSGTYTVSLGGQPTGNATVTATSGDAAVHVDTDASPLARTLTFTPMNWDTAQTVTAAPQDDDDAAGESVTIAHAVANYGGATAASVSVTVDDDETNGIVIDADPSTATVVDAGPVALREDAMHADNSRTYSVKLAAEPTATVTVTVTSTDTAAVTVDTDAATGLQSTLSFTTTNWDTAQTVTLAAVQDTDPNNEETAIDHAAANGGYNGVTGRLTATVADDDVGVIVDTAPGRAGDQTTPIALREGQTGTYTVRLSTQPAGGNVTVEATSGNGAIDVAAGTSGGTFGSTASLTFTATDWATAQTVRVFAEHDVDAVGEWEDVSNTATGGQYSGETTDVRVTAQDDEMGGTDYDADDDFLIEIDSLAKLNAVRWDLDGDGDVDSSANEAGYRAAFAGSVMAEDMGCLDGPDADQEGDCAGYELAAALDFDTDDDGDVDADDDYPNWAPIGGTYSATFDGNNHVISNLTIVDAAGSAGLFNTVGGAVRGLGLADVDVSGVGGSSTDIAPLAVVVNGTVIASWASGRVHVGSTGLARAGGLVGRVTGSGSRLAASYSTASVTGAGNSASYAGGLAALIHNGATVVACYATGLVDEGGSGSVRAGGLIGGNTGPTTVRASYFAGTVAGSGVSGVTAADDGSGENYHNVYYDSGTTGLTAGSAAQTTSALQGPTSATGMLYAAWDDLDVNGNGTADEDPWDFGTAYNHPALKYGGLDVAAQRNDYDADGDGLIDISTLGQLHAVRWDLDGDGAPSTGNESSYYGSSAFFNGAFNPSGMGLCPTTEDDADDNDCLGYELLNDLDFDTDGSGATWTESGGTVTGDSDDAYDNAGAGWEPIGAATAVGVSTHFNATFDGNGKIIDNLFVNRARDNSGLFAGLSANAKVLALGLPDALVRDGQDNVGVLAGESRGRIGAVWSSGAVVGDDDVGGLVGENRSFIAASYSTAAVECEDATGSGAGLAGVNSLLIDTSYSTGEVTGACATKAGLATGAGAAIGSYWDADLSRIADDVDDPPASPEGKSTLDLQTPTAYGTGTDDLYSTWDEQDVDGDGVYGEEEDGDPWEFGLPNQHPILKYRGLAAAPQLAAQPPVPDFGDRTVSNKTFQNGRAIQSFQVPAASGGNGALVYAQNGLPAGLSLGTPTCATARTVCGTPTADAAAVTVTITVSDSDMTTGSTDEDTLTFTVEVVTPSAAISSPAALAEATLNGATVTVALTNAAFEVGAAAANFSLTTNPGLSGLSVASVATVNAGDTSATLTLGYSGGNFDTLRTFAVTVADSAHTLAGALTTGTVNIVPTPSVAVSPTSLSLTEGGGSGSYTVRLGGQPAGNVVVTATSDDAAATIDTDATPLTRALTFTTTNWNTAQTVTVAPADDDDAVDESVTIAHAVANYGGATAASVSVTVEDDETARLVIDADPSTANVVDAGPVALQEDAMHADNSRTYSVKLAAEPTGTVTVTVTSADTAAVTVDTAPATGLQSALSFATTNWDTAQTVTLAAVQDDDPTSEEIAIDHAAQGGGYDGVAARLTATVADDDVGVLVDTDPNTAGDQTTPLALREGQTRTYRVRLSTLPAAGNVTVAVSSGNGAIDVAAGASGGTFGSTADLTFTATDWATAQTVRVFAEHDADAVGEWTTISNAATGAQYSGETTTVRATARDDEMRGTDYDADDDFLIEVDSLAKLNAVRWDLGGDGDVDSSANETSYRAAFAGSIMAEDMGCLDGPDVDEEGDCAGYELMADLDFDTDRDGDVDADDPDSYANWTPIGTYSAVFHGNNRTISNLTIVDAAGNAALFNGVSGTVRSLGLADVDVSGVGSSSDSVAPLVAELTGKVIASWASGRARAGATGNPGVAGLVGRMSGSSALLSASYSTARVAGASSSGSYTSGLVGSVVIGPKIVACYATGAVSGGGNAGGLIGDNTGPTTVAASYFAGSVSGGNTTGGVTAQNDGSGETYNNVYFDAGTTGLASGDGRQTTSDLQTPTSATGTLYANWDDLDVNGNGTADEDPWDFGTAYNHPALNYGGLDPADQRIDYDADDDGLIEISTLGQLNAVRWDLDGDGAPSTGNETSYHAVGAFLNPRFQPGGAGLCPTTAADADDDDCAGYELLNDLDFDTDGDGSTWTEPGGTLTGDMNDAYDNGGMGWEPIGPATAVTAATHFDATFDGNGKLIDNLFVNRSRNRSGLFAGLAGDAAVVALGLPDARVESGTGGRTGALAGENRGHVGAVWASGSVGGASATGGLVGDLSGGGSVVASYSAAAVACAGTNSSGAGLVGDRTGAGSSIAASYSTGTVTGATCASTGGFALGSAGTVAASYWDTTLSQIADDTENPPQPPEGRTTAILQAPTSYDTVAGGEALYAAWDEQDVDGDGATGDGGDADPWDFGRPNQHPILKYAGLAAAPQLDAQPDTAPAFSGTVDDMTLPGAVAVSFQVPAATAGNGAYRYAASGLPTGLSFGLPDCATERTVCGAPTAASTGTVTVTVSDGDSNMEATDRDTLTFMATVPAASASIASTTPTALAETNLNGARVVVELAGTVFVGGLSPSGFQLATTPTIAGLSIASATRTSDTEATLTLRFDGTDFDTQATLLVRVLAAAHRFGGDQDTGAVAVAPAGGVMLSATTLALEEDPGTSNANVGTYTAVLTGQPAGAVTVTPASSNPDVTLSGALTFNATNWNTAQTVTATAGQDDDAVDDVAHVTHAVQGVPGVTSGPRVRVTVNDKDAQGLTLDAATLTGSGVTEGMTATYTVRLASEPTGPVTVAISSSEDAATVDADAGAAGAQNTLLFHAMNWNAAQTVTVRAAEDNDGESETATLAHAVSGADYGEVEDADVSFTVTDNDTKGATLSTTTLNVQENGTATYTLVLDTQPVDGAVTVAVASATGTVATARPATLTFTAGNWDAPQTVTVSGVDDTDTADESETIGHTPTGGGYDGVSIPDVTATAVDDDAAGLKVSPVNLTVAEGGTATYAVRLNVAPTAAVSVQVVSNSLKATVDTDSGTSGDQSTLSFDAANWNTAQTVTVTGAEDADGADETASLTHAVTGTGDYAALAAIRRPGVAVLVRDDETAGVVLSPTSLAVDEGGTATYDVELSAPPATGTATVTIAATGMAGLTVDASTLSFTTTTWDTAQTVTVTAVADHARLADAQGTLTHAVSGYGAVESGPDLPVRVANTTVDYDADADGLIEIGSLAQLNAMRWDLDGDGAASSGNAATYATAFPTPRGGGVCPTATSGTACDGFELTADLDFDTDGDGATHAAGVGDDGDDHHNGGFGWRPVGDGAAAPFAGRFDGNGRILRNLFVNAAATNYRGLFGVVSGRVAAVGLANAWVRGAHGAGALAGFATAAARVTGAWSTGAVSGDTSAGGLVGRTQTGARIAASYSTAAVECRNSAAGYAGGLAGGDGGTATVSTSWSAGAVTGACPDKAGLVGGPVAATASWWDAAASGIPDDADLDSPEGRSTSDLQTPTSYAGLYANWNVDLDGDYEADDPWHFGSPRQYPSLKWRGFDPSQQFAVSEEPDEPAEESSVPTEVRAETTSQGLLVTWRAVAGATAYLVQWRLSGQAWSPQRQAETTETRYEIAGLAAGAYEVRVLAVVDGKAGEPSEPARGEAGTPNRPPLAHGIADVDMDVGKTSEVDLDAAFSDPDGDVLRYAASADGGAVQAWASGGTLRLRGMRPGEATVTATATDPEGLSASATFTVRVGAVLSLRGNPAAPEGGEAVLTAELSRPLGSDVEVGWRLAADGEPGTADADAADFAAWAGTATVAAGQTRTRIVLAVLDDDDIEPARERFAVELEEPADPNVGLSARAWRALGAVQEGVCDRTPEVRAELARGWRACRWPSSADLARLSRLDLRGAGVESLRADDLLGLSGLRTLALGGNALRELPAGLLSHSPRLRSLRLDGNRLESLPAALFAGVSGLRELRLSGNPGAPFALAPTLRRTDAEPWAAGPATVEARLPLGAPFAMRLALTVAGGEASAEELALAAGAVASGTASVFGDGPVRVVLAAPAIPQTRCGDGPCFDGLAAEGAALALFAAPPRVAGEVAPAELLGADAVRIDLSAHFAAGGGGTLSYSAAVDDPRLATASVDGAFLLVSANEDGEEGVATVTVVATDHFGQTATLRFAVEVSPSAAGRWRGWRSVVAPPAAGQ